MLDGKNVKILLPDTYVNIPVTRLYFTAGPILGADDWQATAIKLFAQYDSECYIACPCRYDDTHPLYQYRAMPPEDASEHSNQTYWERYYIRMSMHTGCLIFWLPRESRIAPRPKDQGPYAQDTYGEIGRYFTHKIYSPNLQVVLGYEEGFPGIKTIINNLLAESSAWQAHIYTSLEETVKAATKRALNLFPSP